MAEDTTNETRQGDAPAQADGVRLVAPDGSGEVTVRSPEAVNNLVYGQGYRLVGDDDPEAAVKAAADNDSDSGEGTQAPSPPTVGSVSETTGTSKTTRAGSKAAGAGTTPPSTT